LLRVAAAAAMGVRVGVDAAAGVAGADAGGADLVAVVSLEVAMGNRDEENGVALPFSFPSTPSPRAVAEIDRLEASPEVAATCG